MMSNAPEVSKFKQRQPALYCVIAFALGIFLDRQLGEASQLLSLGIWISLSCTFLLAWGVFIFFFAVPAKSARCRKYDLLLLLIALVSSGGAIHHLHWNTASPNLLARLVSEKSSPVRLVARIETVPTFLPSRLPKFAAAWPVEDRTRCEASVVKLIQHSEKIVVRGRILLTILGDATHLQTGDTVRVIGTVRNLPPARNPAGFDFASLMRQKKIFSSLFCRSPEAVTKVGASTETPVSFLSRVQQKIRRKTRSVFVNSLPEEESGIAQALLLGDRQSLEEQVLFSFQRSGLMHLLSISGLHVGLVGYLFFILGRWLNFSQRSLFCLMFIGITFCVIMAELRPPVLRAWLIGLVFISGWVMQKKVGFLQSLSISAWLILLINPSWLFDRGTQLSFLAMLAIYGLWKIMPEVFAENNHFAASQSESHLSAQGKRFSFWEITLWLVRKIGRYSWQSLVISLVVTIVAMPLLANSFGRVTLTGIPATILSLPVLAISLILLIVLAGAGMVSSTVATWVAIPASTSLNALHLIAEFFSQETLLQWTSCRPGNWFLLAIYGLGMIAFCYSAKNSHRQKVAFLSVWMILVIIGVGCKRTSGMLECRVLSVGHGNAVLVKCPNGKTVLFDGGSMQNGQFAASVIQANLADMGADRLDAVLISHADTDHLNAIPFLIEQIPIKTILLNPAGLNPFHPGMYAITSGAYQRGLRLQTVCTGDFIPLDKEVEIHIKQCPASPLEKVGNDNADSIVVELKYRGKRFLLPGDLEGGGQQKLMQQSSPGYDILLAPHHGGKKENTPQFAVWAAPKSVIVSSNDTKMKKHLETIYLENENLLFTASGAIRITVTSSGNLEVSQWQRSQHWGFR